jgi:hypothetical protein
MNTDSIKVGDPATPLHDGDDCGASHSDTWTVCTEQVGHDGPHIASGTTEVIAVWS